MKASPAVCACLLAMMLAAGFSQAWPQTPSIPTSDATFDVASIKALKPGEGPDNRKITADHGSLMMQQQNLREVIAWAYDIQHARIKGPSWLDSEEYDIFAKAPERTPPDQLKMMLRSLLRQRFKLLLHHTTEQHPLYALVRGKGDLKLREVQKQSTSGGMFGLNNEVFTKDFVINMPQLAEALPIFLDTPVVDKTGLSGVYEFTVKVEIDPQTRLPERGEIFTGFGMTPGIFRAVEELGLKLVPQKGPVDVLVIDHVEPPTPN